MVRAQQLEIARARNDRIPQHHPCRVAAAAAGRQHGQRCAQPRAEPDDAAAPVRRRSSSCAAQTSRRQPSNRHRCRRRANRRRRSSRSAAPPRPNARAGRPAGGTGGARGWPPGRTARRSAPPERCRRASPHGKSPNSWRETGPKSSGVMRRVRVDERAVERPAHRAGRPCEGAQRPGQRGRKTARGARAHGGGQPHFACIGHDADVEAARVEADAQADRLQAGFLARPAVEEGAVARLGLQLRQRLATRPA